MSFTSKKIFTTNRFVMGKTANTALILLVAGAVFFMLLKDLFFFDEDIFVTNLNGTFMNDMWQRSFFVKLTLAADHFLWGKNPAGYHITNLIFHLLDSILAMAVFKNLLKLLPVNEAQDITRIAPALFFVLFLVTPVHSEVLCYILARGGSVVCFFCLLSILFFIKARFKNKSLLFLSILSFAVALFCYEISWLLPLIILCIILFMLYCSHQSGRKKILFALPYFLSFAAWFIIKVVIVDKMEVSDYKDSNLFSAHLLTLCKNSAVLFLRNFIPPFKSTLLFLTVSIAFCLLIAVVFFTLFKKSKPIFYLAVLLLLCTILSFAPVALIGIDSHDSESERYIYFSSAFALMLLAVLLTALVKKRALLITVSVILCSYYAYTCFKTIGYYKQAGDFSRTYLKLIEMELKGNEETVYFVNQPSQYEGALLYRAKSKIEGNTNDDVGIMQEYLSYLFAKNNNCVTLSKNELIAPPQIYATRVLWLEKITDYFPGFILDNKNEKVGLTPGKMYPFIQNKTLVVAFKNGIIYFFK